MESDLFGGALPFPVNFTTLAVALAIACGVLAFTRGVLGLLVGAACLLVGAFVGYSCHSLLPGWLSHVADNPSPRAVFFIALAIGFSVYMILRLLAGALLIGPFKRKGRRLIGGPLGLALSLVPTLVGVFVIGVTLRMAGTLFSIEHTNASVATVEGEKGGARPFWARWNEALDRDYLGSLIAKFDPFAARARGAISHLLVVLRDDAVGDSLADDPAAAKVLRSRSMQDLAADPEMAELVNNGDYIKMFDHPKLRRVASDPEVAQVIGDLRVEKTVDASLYAVRDDGELVRRVRRIRFGVH